MVGVNDRKARASHKLDEKRLKRCNRSYYGGNPSKRKGQLRSNPSAKLPEHKNNERMTTICDALRDPSTARTNSSLELATAKQFAAKILFRLAQWKRTLPHRQFSSPSLPEEASCLTSSSARALRTYNLNGRSLNLDSFTSSPPTSYKPRNHHCSRFMDDQCSPPSTSRFPE
jgi:hypothetical protein